MDDISKNSSWVDVTKFVIASNIIIAGSVAIVLGIVTHFLLPMQLPRAYYQPAQQEKCASTSRYLG
jgi:hypothetical protein